MNSKFFKKKLKLKNLEKIFSSPIFVISQVNFEKSLKENEFLKRISENQFKSKMISSIFLRNFLKKDYFPLSSLSSNILQLIYSSSSQQKKDFFNFLDFIAKKRYNILLKVYLFSHFINKKTLNFLFSYFYLIGLKKFLYKFFLKMNPVALIVKRKVNNGI